MYSCGRQSPVWPVDERAMTAGERARTSTLARHKEYHREYQPERPLPDEVSPTAKRAASSERIASLAKGRYKSESQFRDPLWEVSADHITSTLGCCDANHAIGDVTFFNHVIYGFSTLCEPFLITLKFAS